MVLVGIVSLLLGCAAGVTFAPEKIVYQDKEVPVATLCPVIPACPTCSLSCPAPVTLEKEVIKTVEVESQSCIELNKDFLSCTDNLAATNEWLDLKYNLDIKDVVDEMTYFSKAKMEIATELLDHEDFDRLGYKLKDISIDDVYDFEIQTINKDDKEYKITATAEVLYQDKDSKTRKEWFTTVYYSLDRNDKEQVDMHISEDEE